MSSRASLNHIYRTVWNQALGAMVAVAEISSAGGRSGTARVRSLELQQPGGVRLSALALLVALAWGALPGSAHANPTGGVAVAGSATFVNTGNHLQVTTQNAAGTNHSAINWQSFSIPAGSSTYFQQPNAASTSINRVVTNTPTQIFGSLSSNGNLVLVNHAGIAVGTGAVVDTNGFTASTLAMSDADAMAGRLRFGDGQIGVAGLSVNGGILARNGDVVLLGSNISTGAQALVQAPNGSAVLAAGQQVEITGRGLEGIRLQVQAPTDSAVNLGQLNGNAVGIFAGTLKHSGAIQATTATMEGGRVVLKASGDAIVEGNGSIVATGVTGGSVDVLGHRVGLTDNASVDVSGQLGGGSIRVGGDYQGANADVPNAAMTYFGQNASLKADALNTGNGGKVIVWADDATRAYGTISARGGAVSGNGGFVETSGKAYLDFQGRVDTRATNGASGTLLLDPSDITIATGADALISGASPFVGTSGTVSTLSVATLETALASGNVIVDASSGPGTGTGNITVSNAVTWVNPHQLTLQTSSAGAIALNASLNGAAGSVKLDAGSGGIAVAGGATITTDALQVVSGGSVALGGYNVVNTLAAAVSSGTFGFEGTGGFTVGTVNGTVGVTTAGGNIEIRNYTAGDVTVANNVSAGSGEVLIGLASGSGVNLAINSGTTITGDRVQLYVPSYSSITSQGTLTGGAGGVDLTGPGGISVGGGAITATNGTITLNSNMGSVVQTTGGSMTANALSVTAGGAVDIKAGTNTVNDFSVGVSGGTNTVSYWNTGALNLGSISVNGSLDLKSNGGNITQSGPMGTGGYGYSVGINAGAGNITLVDSGNSFGTAALSLTGSAIAVHANSALNISTLSRTGNHGLDLRAEGGTLTIPGGPINTGTEDLTLVSSSGSLSTYSSLTGANITLKAGNGIYLNSNLDATGGIIKLDGGNGSITQQVTSPPISIKADSLEAILPGGYGSISLESSANQVNKIAAYINYNGSGDFSYNGASSGLEIGSVGDTDGVDIPGNVSITNTGGINIAEDIYASGNVSMSAGGAITHSNSTGNTISANGTITLTGTSIGAAGGDSYYWGGGYGQVAMLTAGTIPGYGNAVLLYPGSGDVILTATAGSIHVFSDGDLNVGSATATGAVHLTTIGSLTLNGNISAGAAGDAVVLDISSYDQYRDYSSYSSINTNGYGISTPNGRWLMYHTGYGGVSLGSLTPAFKQYNTLNGDTVLGSGNGILYYDDPGLSGTLTGTVSKVYDGSTSIDLTGAGISGASTSLGYDDVSSAVLGGGNGIMVDANVGSGKQVDAEWVKLTGVLASESGGYGMTVYYPWTSSVSGAIATVTPARAIITVGGTGTRAYNGSATVLADIFSLSGLINGETLTLSGYGTMADKNVGTNKSVNVSNLALGDGSNGGYASNYTLDGAVFTATITPLAIAGYTGLGVDNKPYDGKTTAMVNTTNAVVSGLLSGDVVNLSAGSASANFDTKNAGTAKNVTISGLTLSGADAGNYTMTAAQGSTTAIGNITPLTLTSVSGITSSKVYDGTTDGKSVSLSGAQVNGLIAGDTVTLGGTADVLYSDRNVGSKTLSLGGFSGLTLTGADAGNYLLGTDLTGTGSGTITQRPTATWSGAAGNGLWSDAKNWDYLPDGSNVAAVAGLGGATVIYDIGVQTVLNSLTAGNLTITTGDLVLGSGLTVNGGYNQTGGKVTVSSGAASITTTGNLQVGTMTAPTVTLNSGGTIGQSGALSVSGKLTTTSAGSTNLTNTGNHIATYQGTVTGPGSIDLYTVGAMQLDGINTQNGNVHLINYGGILSEGGIVVGGSVSLTANSPLVINGGITATGNIDLVATNQTSEGNVTINGAVKSSGGAVAVAAASNYVQNGSIQAAQGVSASAGGSMSFGPNAITTGNPVNFEAGGTVIVPPGAAPTTGSTPTDFVATFLNKFQESVTTQNASTDPDENKKKEKDVVVEGQTCAR